MASAATGSVAAAPGSREQRCSGGSRRNLGAGSGRLGK